MADGNAVLTERGIEYRIHPVDNGGVVVIGKIYNSSFPGFVVYYKNVKEAIRENVKGMSGAIGELMRTSADGDGIDEWLSDFRQKLEWICKD